MMNHKVKASTNHNLPCDKYLNRIFRQEGNSVTRRSQPARPYQDKLSHVTRPISPTYPQRPKPKPNARQQSPIQKLTAQMMYGIQKEHADASKDTTKSSKVKPRSRSSSGTREVWGQILHNNKSKEKMSSFSSFDPLRTLHFLSKELAMRLQNIVPDNGEVIQMISDIQLALKRIPSEVTPVMSKPDQSVTEVSAHLHKTSTKTCQTPPTLYQEDTERFQKIMEENTFRLEASCKQLEAVCANLQSEKEMTEKDLEEARDHIEFLCKKIKALEDEKEELSNIKIKQIQEEKQHLEQQLNKAVQEVNNNPTLNHLRNLVDELKRQKSESDEMCARQEYDMTLLKMEKEKFVTMLAVRDKEIKEIQDEMSKIQEQVTKQLSKLNSETVERVNSIRSFSDQFCGMPDNVFLEIGDTTISSISTNESGKINVIKESPCGDAKLAGMTQESRDDFLEKLQDENVENELAKNKEAASFENLLTGLTPSIQALLAANNVMS